MRLWRYFAAHYLAMIALTLTLLVVLVVAVTLIDNAADLTTTATGGAVAWRLALCGAIEFTYLTLPIACFIGALVAGTQLAKRGELLAVQAAGMHPWTLWGPFVMVTVLVTSLGAVLGETAVPMAAAMRGRIAAEHLQKVDPLARFYARRNPWFREGPWLLYLPEAAPQTATFARPQVFRFADGLIAESIDADALSYQDHGWWLYHAARRSVAVAEVQRIDRLWLPLRVGPDDLMASTGNPREMPSVEVMRLIARRRNANMDTAAYRVELHNRVTHPATALVLVLIGLPWFTDVGRRQSLAVTLGVGAAVVAVALATSQVFRLLALGHKIAAPWGAWGGVVVAVALLPWSFRLYRSHRGH